MATLCDSAERGSGLQVQTCAFTHVAATGDCRVRLVIGNIINWFRRGLEAGHVTKVRCLNHIVQFM